MSCVYWEIDDNYNNKSLSGKHLSKHKDSNFNFYELFYEFNYNLSAAELL